MITELEEKSHKMLSFVGGNPDQPASQVRNFPELPSQAEMLRSRFNLEWFLIPTFEELPMDDRFFSRLYPRVGRTTGVHERDASIVSRERLVAGHEKHQGRLIAVETTQKPRYLPGNRQFYGTEYGFEYRADPITPYLGRAGFVNGTRYDHNYISLRTLIQVITDDWSGAGLLPEGYRVTVCPPAVFNLVGSVFHEEWSRTQSLELGFYRDEKGNATCFAVGCNGPGDYSYIRMVEGEAAWTLLGFRLALVPIE